MSGSYANIIATCLNLFAGNKLINYETNLKIFDFIKYETCPIFYTDHVVDQHYDKILTININHISLYESILVFTKKIFKEFLLISLNTFYNIQDN
jgi:hypothetical protein